MEETSVLGNRIGIINSGDMKCVGSKSIYPTNLPSYVYNHDPTKIDYRKSSHIYQDKKRQGLLKEEKTFNIGDSQSTEDFELDFVKYDKQTLRFYGYFKES